jgi:hypothetical protein
LNQPTKKIKKFKLWQWKRKLKQHQGFSKETNDFIKRIVEHINTIEFQCSDMNKQIEFIMQSYIAMETLEVICNMNKMFNQFFDAIDNNKDK